jgi:protein-tyrosine-phosphatase
VPRTVFEVVFVCTGNRARSPLAEALFRRAATDLPVAVSSLGTLDLGSIPPLPEAEREALRLGLDLSGHRSRPLLGADLGAADLVLGFERMHVVSAVVDARAVRARSFTLPELVPLLERLDLPPARDPVERARLAVAAAHAERPDPAMTEVAELADPLGGGAAVFRDTADRVADLTGRLAVRLFG